MPNEYVTVLLEQTVSLIGCISIFTLTQYFAKNVKSEFIFDVSRGLKIITTIFILIGMTMGFAAYKDGQYDAINQKTKGVYTATNGDIISFTDSAAVLEFTEGGVTTKIAYEKTKPDKISFKYKDEDYAGLIKEGNKNTEILVTNNQTETIFSNNNLQLDNNKQIDTTENSEVSDKARKIANRQAIVDTMQQMYQQMK